MSTRPFDFVGSFSSKDAEMRNLHLATGIGGSLELGCMVQLHLLVDPEDGVVVDACFQNYSNFDIAAVMEALCAFCQRKTYAQASHVTAEILQKQVKNQVEQINLCLEALDEAVDTCLHIEPAQSLQTPQPLHQEEAKVIEGFARLTKSKKKQIIENVLDEKIRPYIEMDAGGLEVIDLDKNELLIRYTGACTSCPSSMGGTLAYIEKVLNSNVDPDLIVRPVFKEGEMLF